MPNFDQTGPVGQGSMTGRKAGKCAGEKLEANQQGRGKGLAGRKAGKGTGAGCRHRNGAIDQQ
jgi:hypothetical protein